MADKGEESKNDSFVFGQRMDERAIQGSTKSFADPVGDSVKTEKTGDTENNGVSSSEGLSVVCGQSVTSSTDTSGPFGQSSCGSKWSPSGNPFAPKTSTHSLSTPNTSDSEDDKKEKPILAPSSFAIKKAEEKPKRSFFMKPSGLDTHTSVSLKEKSSLPFKLKPAKLKGPDSSSRQIDESKSSSQNSESTSPDTTDKTEVKTIEQNKTKGLLGNTILKGTHFKKLDDTSIMSNGSTEGPTASHQSFKKPAESSLQSTGDKKFVFGENLHNRVENADHTDPRSANNGTDDAENKEVDSSNSSAHKTLAESANEYTKKHSLPQYDEVPIVTGEEEESNVLQANCKLFIFDHSSQTWLERGRGQLRINDRIPSEDDTSPLQSRVVMRTSGSLRVVLNTKVWPGMMIDRASQKSVRITAQDSDGVRIVLLMSTPKDTEQIFQALDWRVQQLKVVNETVSSSSQAEENEEVVTKRKASTPTSDDECSSAKKIRTNSVDSEDLNPGSGDYAVTSTRKDELIDGEVKK